jgi:hypothetical protein
MIEAATVGALVLEFRTSVRTVGAELGRRWGRLLALHTQHRLLLEWTDG